MDNYSVEDFLQRAKNKSLGQLIVDSHQEYRVLQQLYITPKHSLYKYKDRIEHYSKFVGEFCFFICQLQKPAGMSDLQFRQTRPVLEALVERKELLPTVLAIYAHSPP